MTGCFYILKMELELYSIRFILLDERIISCGTVVFFMRYLWKKRFVSLMVLVREIQFQQRDDFDGIVHSCNAIVKVGSLTTCQRNWWVVWCIILLHSRYGRIWKRCLVRWMKPKHFSWLERYIKRNKARWILHHFLARWSYFRMNYLP